MLNSMRMLHLVMALATFSVVAPQQPPLKYAGAAAPGSVTLPAEVKGDVGAFVVIVAQTDGKAVRFVPLDGGLSVFPSELLNNRKVTVVVASKPGRYRILAYSAAGDEPGEPAFTTVIIGNPGPEPGPTPGPTSPLTKALQSAFDGETDADKAKLAGLVVAMEKASEKANDPALTTAGQLESAVRTLTTGSIGSSLPATRKAVGAFLAEKLPASSDTALTPELRGAAGSAYGQVAEALRGVK
jgi:hypothetical protein